MLAATTHLFSIHAQRKVQPCSTSLFGISSSSTSSTVGIGSHHILPRSITSSELIAKPLSLTPLATNETMAALRSPPHPSSTLVNISDDADPRLVRVLAPSTPDPSAFESACASAIAAGDAAGLLRTVIDAGAVAGLLSNRYGVDEAVSAFSLLTVYLDRVSDGAVERELCAALADAVGSPGDGEEEGDDGKAARKRSAMVAALFNLRADGREKVRLLARIVELADADALSPGEPRGVSALADALDADALKASLALWGAGDGGAELRPLYGAVAKGMDRVLEALATGEGDKATAAKVAAAKERKQTYMLLFLETYKDEVSGCVTVVLLA